MAHRGGHPLEDRVEAVLSQALAPAVGALVDQVAQAFQRLGYHLRLGLAGLVQLAGRLLALLLLQLIRGGRQLKGARLDPGQPEQRVHLLFDVVRLQAELVARENPHRVQALRMQVTQLLVLQNAKDGQPQLVPLVVRAEAVEDQQVRILWASLNVRLS